MQISSPAFSNNRKFPKEYGLRHGNISPPFDIGEVPQGAKSLVMITVDPDAPSGDFTHWLLWNIPPKTSFIDENEAPKDAVHGTNDFGNTKWDGPAPPNGTHHYHFKLYALDTMLELSAGCNRQEVEAAIKPHVLASAELVGTYSAD